MSKVAKISRSEYKDGVKALGFDTEEFISNLGKASFRSGVKR